MNKTITFGQPAKDALFRGANLLAKAVVSTYGPKGRYALIQRMSGLIPTKDGFTVANEMSLSNPLENQGCQILKQACIKVNDEVGDGTTATALLAIALLRRGLKLLHSGYNPTFLIQEVREAGKAAERAIQGIAGTISTQEELEQIALIACNGDKEIASCLAEACMAVGKDGMVIVEDGQAVETKLEFKEGLEIKHKGIGKRSTWQSVPNVIDGAIVAVVNEPLLSLRATFPMLEEATQWLHNPLIVVAPDIGGDALCNVILSDKKGMLHINPIITPLSGTRRLEILEDIAAITRSTLVDPIAGLDYRQWKSEWFGTLRRAIIKPDSVVLEAYPEADETIKLQISRLKALREKSSSDFDKDRLGERIAGLASGLAVLKIGDFTESALKEKRARVEDALGSVKAALKGGVVPGGGKAYLYAANEIAKLDTLGAKILAETLEMPFKVLSGDPSLMDKVTGDPWMGYSINQDQVRSLLEAPMIADPLLVVLASLRAAISVATTLLSVEVSLCSPVKKAKPSR